MRLLHAVCALATLGAGGATILSLTATTGCNGTGQVRQIFTALDGAGNRPRDVFFTDTALIYCDVIWAGAGTDETIAVQFIQTTGEPSLYDGSGNLQPVSYLWAGAESAPGEGVQTVSFSMNPPTSGGDSGTTLPYTVGHYQCVISVNGQKAGTKDFDVKYPNPDCPASGGAYDGMSCVAYMNNAACPNDSNFQPSGQQCVCQSNEADPLSRVFTCN